jgi:hypothetical protein
MSDRFQKKDKGHRAEADPDPDQGGHQQEAARFPLRDYADSG